MAASELAVAQSAFVVTPHNSTNFTKRARALYVGVGGNITLVTGGVAVLFTNVPQGTILPVECSRVNSTGTTASSLVGLV